ncbi:hypothetical protein [Exiguobacterium sp. K1]|uniref:hypothetical protein n=1 Tax=Exiguobacterium sp. K1 TaxID=2980105 RepID=UPI00299E10B9|nr:hypothetical protein [Exiguobacterium sp. K1]MDX1259079.1 hypothetical protein [Exiguobacterium sp. K1]
MPENWTAVRVRPVSSNVSRMTDSAGDSPGSILPPTPFYIPIAGCFCRFSSNH